MTSRGQKPERISSERVIAWWDLDVNIGAFNKRKVTARPLKDLERVLGHRLHVEGWMRYDYMPEGIWKLEAFNYFDTADPALAAYATLKQVSALSDWFGTSWQGYNSAATALADDPDGKTICAFYWNIPDQFGMRRYPASGVLLRLDDLTRKPFDQRERFCRSVRPVVGIPSVPQSCSDYSVEFTVHITCDNVDDLLSRHWPRLRESRWPNGISDFEVDSQVHLGKPNIIRVRQVVRGVREPEAVAYCLSFAQSFRIKLNGGSDFHFVGERQPGREHPDGIVAFDMKKTIAD
jgi:hypothetical protein